MKKRILRAAIVIAAFLGATVSPPSQALGLHLLAIQANAIYVDPKVGDSIWSGQVAWIPNLDLEVIRIRAELGATLLKGSAPSTFFATNFEGFAGLPVAPMISIEAGGGIETFHGGNGGTNPIVSGYFVFSPPGVDRLFFAYSRYFLPDNNANEIKIGIGFSL